MSVTILTDVSVQKPMINCRCQDLIVDGTIAFNSGLLPTNISPSLVADSVLTSDSLTNTWSTNPVVGSIQFSGASQSALTVYSVSGTISCPFVYGTQAGNANIIFTRIGNLVAGRIVGQLLIPGELLAADFTISGIPPVFIPISDVILSMPLREWTSGGIPSHNYSKVSIGGVMTLYDETIPGGLAPQNMGVHANTIFSYLVN